MKTLKLLLILCPLFILNSCNDDNDRNHCESALSGTWNLTNVSGGFAGVNYNFPEGTIKWTFNASNETVTVVNNNSDESAIEILPSGTYPYTIQNNEVSTETCMQTLSVNNFNYGCLTITNRQFTVSQLEADGFMIIFKK